MSHLPFPSPGRDPRFEEIAPFQHLDGLTSDKSARWRPLTDLKSALKEGETIAQMVQRYLGRPLIIMVVGPAGGGKDTFCKRCARYYGVNWISSGSAFRGFAYIALKELEGFDQRKWVQRRQSEERLAKSDAQQARKELFTKSEVYALDRLASSLVAEGRLRIEVTPRGQQVFYRDLHGKVSNISDKLHDNEIATGASIVAEIPRLRKALLSLVRDLGANGCVMSARNAKEIFPPAEDSVVPLGLNQDVPRALINVWMEAPLAVRAKFRMEEQTGGKRLRKAVRDQMFVEQQKLIASRDAHDLARKHSPLEKPAGAIEISACSDGVLKVERSAWAKWKDIDPEKIYTQEQTFLRAVGDCDARLLELINARLLEQADQQSDPH